MNLLITRVVVYSVVFIGGAFIWLIKREVKNNGSRNFRKDKRVTK